MDVTAVLLLLSGLAMGARAGRAGGAVGADNRTAGSREARVLVGARRMRDLRMVEDDLAVPSRVEQTGRALSAPELVASAAEGNRLRSLPPFDGRAYAWSPLSSGQSVPQSSAQSSAQLSSKASARSSPSSPTLPRLPGESADGPGDEGPGHTGHPGGSVRIS
ncbi:hypothetical protein [Streptodolium elevatio]